MTRVGIIAEDESDVQVARELILKFKSKNSFCIKHFLGHGCGKIRHKCATWSKQLYLKGCSVLILLHDLDRNNKKQLREDIEKALYPCPISENIIVIPVEEIEAWLMCDVNALKKTFSIKKSFKLPNNPESIVSPKEKLEQIIWIYSGKTKRYLHTQHNAVIAKNIPVAALQKCPAFHDFAKFVKTAVK
jgi:hypothetical protein